MATSIEPEREPLAEAMGPAWGQSPTSPRGDALADLYRHAERLASLGDIAGARRLHATIGALLEGASPGDNAEVVDLNAERAKRGGT